MAEAARVFAELDIPGASGERIRTHLEKVSEQTGGKTHDPRLDVVPPAEGLHVWEVFWQVWNGQRVDFRELESYSRLTGDILDPWEVAAVRMMDGAVASVIGERARKNRDRPGESTNKGRKPTG
nr:hypothetical protein 8 [Spirochaetaceae bacterium]